MSTIDITENNLEKITINGDVSWKNSFENNFIGGMLMESDAGIVQRPLSELIAEKLKQKIWNQEVQFGERLLESDLAEHYDVSRSTLREALRILENEALVVSRARKGTYVAEFSKKDRDEIVELRTLLEAHAFRQATAHLKDKHFNELGAIIGEMKTQALAKNWSKLFDLDMRFHSYVVQLSDNSRLIKIYNSIQVQIRTLLVHLDQYYSSHEAFFEEHKQLLGALKTKDANRVTKQVQDHIVFIGEKLIDTEEENINLKEATK